MRVGLVRVFHHLKGVAAYSWLPAHRAGYEVSFDAYISLLCHRALCLGHDFLECLYVVEGPQRGDGSAVRTIDKLVPYRTRAGLRSKVFLEDTRYDKDLELAAE